jgi:hypothetical protein
VTLNKQYKKSSEFQKKKEESYKHPLQISAKYREQEVLGCDTV